MDIVLRVLNAIITAIDVAVSAVGRFIDRLINAVQSISKKIISLLLALFRLMFYLMPFVLFVVIGSSKQWLILKYIGVVFLAFATLLFLRDYLMGLKDQNYGKASVEVEHASRVIVIMLILNAITIAYATFYYCFNVSIETVIGRFAQDWLSAVHK